MKISYDSSKIKNVVKKDVDYLKNKVSTVLENAQSISVPSDFSRKGDIIGIKSTLASAKSSLINYLLWIEIIDSNMNRAEENNETSLSKIPKKEINKKDKLL